MTGTESHPPTHAEDMTTLTAYRLGQLEKDVRALHGKFDLVAQHYVTAASLMLVLDPIRDRLKELENSEKERDQRRSNESAQFKLALTMAIFSPIMSAIVSFIVALSFGK
jgi:hypothetical protein